MHTETSTKNFGNLSILQIQLIKKWKVLNSHPTDVLGLASRPNLTRSDFDCLNLSKAKSKVITWKLLVEGGGDEPLVGGFVMVDVFMWITQFFYERYCNANS